MQWIPGDHTYWGGISKYEQTIKALNIFLEQCLSSPQQIWLAKMLGYDYEIIYKKGRENIVADALSR